jgi:hypothetical protein
MKINSFLVIFCVLLCSVESSAQDYFEDTKGEGASILLNRGEDWLFSSRLNTADNSIKVNLYRQYMLDQQGFSPRQERRRRSYWGWGLGGKAKVENSLGSVFSSGQLAPGFTGSGYLSLVNRFWDKRAIKSYRSLIVLMYGSISRSEFQLFDTSRTFSSQLIDTSFNGNVLGLSVTYKIHPQKSNVYLGGSVSLSKKNNYKKLDKVEVRNDSIIINGGIQRRVTTVDEGGLTYAIGPYEQYHNTNIRIHATYVPGVFQNRLGFTFYPSIDVTQRFNPMYNLGFSASMLKDGNPSVAQLSIMFEFDDLANARESTKPILRRAFSVGLTAAFNIGTGKAE